MSPFRRKVSRRATFSGLSSSPAPERVGYCVRMLFVNGFLSEKEYEEMTRRVNNWAHLTILEPLDSMKSYL